MFTFDFWRFNFTNIIVQESAQAIIDASMGLDPRIERSPFTGSIPIAATIYTLEVRCIDSPGCLSSDDVLVEIKPAVVPPDLGNRLRAIKSGPNVVLAWPAVVEADTYTIHRGTVKGVWPPTPFRPGISGTTETLPDVAPPPPLYFYRVAGVNCAGVEGP